MNRTSSKIKTVDYGNKSNLSFNIESKRNGSKVKEVEEERKVNTRASSRLKNPSPAKGVKNSKVENPKSKKENKHKERVLKAKEEEQERIQELTKKRKNPNESKQKEAIYSKRKEEKIVVSRKESKTKPKLKIIPKDDSEVDSNESMSSNKPNDMEEDSLPQIKEKKAKVRKQ
jgi:hypothetical protein